MSYFNKKVIIVGGSGFIGTQIAKVLLQQSAQVIIVDPYPSTLKEVAYIQSDLQTIPDFETLEKPFAIFNLAGVPIFGRWNCEYKKKVRESRITTTRNLVEKFRNELFKPEFFVSTSAIGVYGERGCETLDESSSTIQNTYLAQVAYDWEQEALKAQEIGVNVRIIRNAHVLGKGGILRILRKFFSAGFGGTLGKGNQYMSFVSIEECVRAYLRAPFRNEVIKNAVSFEPVTNSFFSKKIASILKRPCFFSIPIWSMQLLYGDFAKEIVISQRVYTAHEPVIEDLESVLKKNI